MAFVHIQLALVVEVVHAHPRVAAAASHELTRVRVQRHRGDFAGGLDCLEQLARLGAREEIGRFPGGYSQRGMGEGAELAATNRTFEIMICSHGARAEIPPTEFLVLACGDEDVGVRAPDDGFDGAVVNPWTDFVAGGRK